MGKQNYTPLLDEDQIAKLAIDLSISKAAVRAVLQAAGHELRERYRKRGWLPSKDSGDRPPNNRGKTQRRATAIAYSQAKAAARDLAAYLNPPKVDPPPPLEYREIYADDIIKDLKA